MPVTPYARGNYYELAVSQDDPTIGLSEQMQPVVKEPYVNRDTDRVSARNTDVLLGDVVEAFVANAHFTPELNAWCVAKDIDPNRLHEIGMAVARLLKA